MPAADINVQMGYSPKKVGVESTSLTYQRKIEI